MPMHMPVRDPGYLFSRQRVEETRRQQATRMPAWLKQNRDAYRDRLAAQAQKSFEETGIWFLSRGAAREKDEQETQAVWGGLLYFCDLESLPGYSEENHRRGIEFWQSWQNLQVGSIYNPLYQDPQHPQIVRHTPGNRDDYSPGSINRKYIPGILSSLGAVLPLPMPTIRTQNLADDGEDSFDVLWGRIAEWATSPAGAIPVDAARVLEAGRLDKIPQIEAGMGALLRAYSRKTGMWRPEPLADFPWCDYQPSSGFKIISRICGETGMENFPEAVLKTGVDNLLAHRDELYDHCAMARNYGEIFAHNLMLSNYRRDEQLDAMEECLKGFRDPVAWESTATGAYCVFGSAFIGAFMNWEDLPFDQALREWQRFLHGCDMKWRFVADPYGNWVNVIRKEPEEILGHPDYDDTKCRLKARNETHWPRRIAEVTRQEDVALKLNSDGKSGAGRLALTLTPDQCARPTALYLKATWSGAYDVSLNAVPVKQVRYNLPDVPAGWHIPPPAIGTLHAGENAVEVQLVGPGKEQQPGSPLSKTAPFIRLGLIEWR